jgi:hypothetical protein
VRPRRCQHVDTGIGSPLEEAPQVMAVCLERSAAVAGEERRNSEVRFVRLDIGHALSKSNHRGLDGCHG